MVRRNDFKAIFGAATFNSPIKNVNKSHKGRGGSSSSSSFHHHHLIRKAKHNVKYIEQ